MLETTSFEELFRIPASLYELREVKEGIPYLKQLVDLANVIDQVLELLHTHPNASIPDDLNPLMNWYGSSIRDLNQKRGGLLILTDDSWDRIAGLISAKTRFRRDIRTQCNGISTMIRLKKTKINIPKDVGPDIDILITLATKLMSIMDRTANGNCPGTDKVDLATTLKSIQTFHSSSPPSPKEADEDFIREDLAHERSFRSNSAVLPPSIPPKSRLGSHSTAQQAPSPRSSSGLRKPSKISRLGTLQRQSPLRESR